jgi:hypothetical protein
VETKIIQRLIALKRRNPRILIIYTNQKKRLKRLQKRMMMRKLNMLNMMMMKMRMTNLKIAML